MAKTGYDFTIGQYRDLPLARPWQGHYRPIPKNMTLVEEPVWRAELEAGRYDVVIAHNESNAGTVFRSNVPKLLVCHNRKTFLRTTARASEDGKDPNALYEELLERLQQRFLFIFISESKRDDYGMPGEVILPGIDVNEFGGYTGETAEILRVGNMMRARNLMFDVDFQESACRGLPCRVAGLDPEIPGAREADSFEDLLHLYRTRRALLHVTRQEYEDGYNLSTLEAMACGMPVVALANLTSPLTDGVDGFVSDDACVLRERLATLLQDRDLAVELGRRARETVAKKFPMERFVENWRRVIETAAEQRSGAGRRVASPPSLNLLMQYVASPVTTARYFEQAARCRHNVVTAGMRCPEAVLDLWGYPRPHPDYTGHDIALPLHGAASDALAKLPPGFKPHVYFWIDSGQSQAPTDLGDIKIPKMCYLIDTHVAPELRLAMAPGFDRVFVAQKACLGQFQEAGIGNVEWLPLACAPELHSVGTMERVYDVAFVGSIPQDASDRRYRLLDQVARRFPNHTMGRFWPDEMARIYAQSKIVINICFDNDVNMRVFEAMASGALLITDEADGLEELFEDGKHLVIYRDDEQACALIEKYLGDEEARERIARAGSELVLAEHTYEKRLEHMLRRVLDAASAGGYVGESRFRSGGYFRNLRPELAQYVPMATQRLLDVGCGGGDFARSLKRRGVKEVYGVETELRACEIARQLLDGAICGSIETIELPWPDGFFDCIVFGDVLEHLYDPTAVLRKVSRVLAEDGIILMSIPNVRFCDVLRMLGNGRWQYMDAGILDRTHVRFFTAHEMRRMVRHAGLEVLDMGALSFLHDEMLPRNEDGSVPLGRLTYHPIDDADYRDLLTYQYRVMAGKPGIDRLKKARGALELHHNEAAFMLAAEAFGADAFEQHMIMGKAAARVGEAERAESIYRAALKLRPEDAEINTELGLLLLGMQRTEEARPFIEQALSVAPENDRACGGYGLLLMLQGKLRESCDHLFRALDESYANHALLPHFVRVCAELDRLDEAAAMLRRYADFYPGMPDVVCEYADLLIAQGRVEEARERLENARIFAPDHEALVQRIDRIDGKI